MIEITDQEASILKQYRDDIISELKKSTIYYGHVIATAHAEDAYKLALYVKYGVSPFKYDISFKEKRFIERK